MNFKRIVLYGLFAVFQIGAFIFTYMVDGHLDLLALLKYIPYFKYISFIGVLLLIFDIMWYLRERESHQLDKDKLRRENDRLNRELSEKKAHH